MRPGSEDTSNNGKCTKKDLVIARSVRCVTTCTPSCSQAVPSGSPKSPEARRRGFGGNDIDTRDCRDVMHAKDMDAPCSPTTECPGDV